MTFTPPRRSAPRRRQAPPRRVVIGVACLAAVLAGVGAGLSYELFPSNLPSGVYRRFFPADLPMHFVVDHEGLATVSDIDGGVTAAVGAAQEWNGGPAGTLVTAQSGTVTGNPIDGVSEIIFNDALSPCDDTNCYAATGWTFYDPDQKGCWTQKSLSMSRILEANVYFNPALQWASLGEVCSSESLVEFYTRHEVGHALGLAHATGNVVMTAGAVPDCWNLPLKPDDSRGAGRHLHRGVQPGSGLRARCRRRPVGGARRQLPRCREPAEQGWCAAQLGR